MTLRANVVMQFSATETASEGLVAASRSTAIDYSHVITDGTEAGQAQVLWTSSRTVDDTGETLNARALPDTRSGASATVDISATKVLVIRNTSDVQTLKIQTAAPSVWLPFPATVALAIPPGGVYAVSARDAAGYAHGATAEASIEAADANDDCTYEILVIGEGSVS